MNGDGGALWRPVGSQAAQTVADFLQHGPRARLSLHGKAVLRLAKRCRMIVRQYWSARENRRLPSGRFARRVRSLGQYMRSAQPGLPLLLHDSRRNEMTLPYQLPERRWIETALAWSTLFGLVAGRLRACEACQSLFVASLQAPRRRTCDACRGRRLGPRPRAAGLPRSMVRLYTLLRKRLDQRVYRRTMKPDERDRLLSEALADVKTLGTAEWGQRWLKATLQPRGRRPGSFLRKEREGFKRGTIPGRGTGRERWKVGIARG